MRVRTRDGLSYKQESSCWQTVGVLPISGRACVADTSYFHDEPLVVAVPPADYHVDVRYGVDAHGQCVSAVRLCRAGTLIRGALRGGVLADFGQIGLCDRDFAERAFDRWGEDGLSGYYRQLQTADLVSSIELVSGPPMWVVRPAAIQGFYPVYLLGGDCVPAGIEVVFEPIEEIFPARK